MSENLWVDLGGTRIRVADVSSLKRENIGRDYLIHVYLASGEHFACGFPSPSARERWLAVNFPTNSGADK